MPDRKNVSNSENEWTIPFLITFLLIAIWEEKLENVILTKKVFKCNDFSFSFIFSLKKQNIVANSIYSFFYIKLIQFSTYHCSIIEDCRFSNSKLRIRCFDIIHQILYHYTFVIFLAISGYFIVFGGYAGNSMFI